MTKTLKVILAALLGHLFSLTAPFVVPLALLFTKKSDTALPKAFAWYDTPDEYSLIGLYEPTVKRIYDRLGWRIAAWYWFGVRNTGHGFQSLFARSAKTHWMASWGLMSKAKKYSAVSGDIWIQTRRVGRFVFVIGWQIYSSKKFSNGLEARPVMSIKNRAIK